MKSKQIGQFVIRTLPLLISAAFASNAFAQSSAEEEVIVSAQKRPERLRDVPMSISAITGQALENRKIEGAADLQGVQLEHRCSACFWIDFSNLHSWTWHGSALHLDGSRNWHVCRWRICRQEPRRSVRLG